MVPFRPICQRVSPPTFHPAPCDLLQKNYLKSQSIIWSLLVNDHLAFKHQKCGTRCHPVSVTAHLSLLSSTTWKLSFSPGPLFEWTVHTWKSACICFIFFPIILWQVAILFIYFLFQGLVCLTWIHFYFMWNLICETCMLVERQCRIHVAIPMLLFRGWDVGAGGLREGREIYAIINVFIFSEIEKCFWWMSGCFSERLSVCSAQGVLFRQENSAI